MSAALAALPANVCPGATQVLGAARALFAEHGVDGVSMQDIATRAGVSKANVFHHFASKEALHIAVLRDCVGTSSVSIEELIASPEPFEQRFLKLMQGEIADMLADESATRLVVREVSQGNPERAKHIAQQIFADTMKERVAFFADAQARGELASGVEPVIGDMLLGACCMFYFTCGRLCQHLGQSIGHPPPATAEDFARSVCRVLMHGMAAPRAARRAKAAKPAAAVAHPSAARRPSRKVTTR